MDMKKLEEFLSRLETVDPSVVEAAGRAVGLELVEDQYGNMVLTTSGGFHKYVIIDNYDGTLGVYLNIADEDGDVGVGSHELELTARVPAERLAEFLEVDAAELEPELEAEVRRFAQRQQD